MRSNIVEGAEAALAAALKGEIAALPTRIRTAAQSYEWTALKKIAVSVTQNKDLST